MIFKKQIKTIFKTITRTLLKIYTNNYSLYIVNNPKDLEHKKFYSQFGQDQYVFENIFKNKSSGFFVDIGANHPIVCSNTYLLESKGWNGIAIEPQESLRELWPQNRTTPCLNYVIGPENKQISFVEATSDEHGLSGVVGFNKVSNSSRTIEVEQIRLDDLFKQKNITHVDYLSIDVEGYEMNVLQSIDFSTVDIKLISVENDLGFKNIPIIGKKLGSELGNNKLRNFIEEKGYTYIARIVCDDFFIKNE
jgi:FkbM family methyltransferase